MNLFAGYSQADWNFGIVIGILSTAIFSIGIFLLRWFWRWVRNFSSDFRRMDQVNRIIRIFVYRRYIGKKTIQSLSRGEFYIISRCLRTFIGGITLIAMGVLLDWFTGWITGISFVLYPYLALSVWFFLDAVSWLDPTWAKKSMNNMDEQALLEAAAILGETENEVRNRVSSPNLAIQAN